MSLSNIIVKKIWGVLPWFSQSVVKAVVRAAKAARANNQIQTTSRGSKSNNFGLLLVFTAIVLYDMISANT
jgi:hypothetical protein